MGNRYLEGNYAPVREERTLTELPVTGTIPAHLDGRYVRNGPNPLGELDPRTYHWFSGDGMVHGVRLRDGKAEWYRNRWVRTPAVARALGEPAPRCAPHHAGLQVIGANTNVLSHAGRTLALVEGGLASYELTGELDTGCPCDFDGTIRGGYTAHPKRDPDTGELHAVSYSFGRGNWVQYSVIGADGRARRMVDVRVTGSPMMHDFSLTENHVVFYDLPVTFDPVAGATITAPPGLRAITRLVLSVLVGRIRIPEPLTAMIGKGMRKNAPLPYKWDPNYPARVGVMPRTGDAADLRWFDIEPCYVFHPLNAYDSGAYDSGAYDSGDCIVLDVVRHPKMFDTERHGPYEGDPTLDRWIVDLSAGKVRQTCLDDHPQEFPRIDERRAGKAYRYGYSIQVRSGRFGDSVLKHDVHREQVITRRLGAQRRVGEFVFVPNGPHSPEDDGVLMGFVYDTGTDRSELMLLDAATLDTVATVDLPIRVPHGFHGNWIPSSP
jgi:carotenoid cleavage dioxygenase